MDAHIYVDFDIKRKDPKRFLDISSTLRDNRLLNISLCEEHKDLLFTIMTKNVVNSEYFRLSLSNGSIKIR